MSRVNHTTLPQNAQVRKIFCAYHPNEFLTNFCCDLECLMPLCPNCIVEHTQQHFLQNNKPSYTNIHEIISQIKQKCYQHIVIFQQLSRSNDRIFDYLIGLKQSIHNQLMEDKLEIIKELDSLFESYQEKIYAQSLGKYRDLEVYDKKETANITDFITEQIQTLHEQIGLLKGQNCLAGLITYLANDGKIYQDSIKQITQYIGKHKKAGKISINGNIEAISKTFDQFCENNLTIEFISDEIKQKEKEQESKLRQSALSKQGRTLANRLSKKQHNNMFVEQNSKQNNINYSNNDYKNLMKRTEDYYKIDSSESKYNRNNLKDYTPSQTRTIPNIRHHY